MMFSATLSKEIRLVCREFTQHPLEIYFDNEVEKKKEEAKEDEREC